jgi:hypothetical protein
MYSIHIDKMATDRGGGAVEDGWKLQLIESTILVPGSNPHLDTILFC